MSLDCAVKLVGLPRKHRKGRREENTQKFDLRKQLFYLTRTDLTRIDGINVVTAITLISEGDGT